MPKLPTRRLQWARGFRGGLAVGASIVGSHFFAQPEGWVALGSFYVVLADNGGPYRSRFKTLATLLVGGVLSISCGAFASGNLLRTLLVTVLLCLLQTFARVVSQHIAGTSILTLVIYFAMLSPHPETASVLTKTLRLFVAGWAWGATLSLILWPLDAFRPARHAVASCYRTLALFADNLAATAGERRTAEDASRKPAPVVHHRQIRLNIEAARRALEETPARSPVRTVRARNLSVLLELADVLFAVLIRSGELSELVSAAASERVHFAQWQRQTARACALIAHNLVVKPRDGGLSFAKDGSYRVDFIPAVAEDRRQAAAPILEHLVAEQREAQQALGLAFDAVYSIWSGLDQTSPERLLRPLEAASAVTRSWWDTLRSNWTLRSLAARHALRVAAVGAADAVIMRVLNVNHGFWLAMTSLIVLQPNAGHTLQLSLQRMRGTLAGGLLAALLALWLQWPPLLLATIVVFAILTCAFYAIDYTWYCFCLTPTFVLMSLPHVRDWRFAGVRVGLTLIGVGTSLAAMRFLWPETERLSLGRLFAQCCLADAAYARSILEVWPLRGTASEPAARRKVAACRRACGLASNDAEESVDRVLLEPEALSQRGMRNQDSAVRQSPRRSAEERWQHELTFVTYIRRLTQSLLAFARLAHGEADTASRLRSLVDRLENLAVCLSTGAGPGELTESLPTPPRGDDLVQMQVRRLELQVTVLERTAARLT